ncbi:V-type ATP synthase subunit C [Lactonifactor longoviformis]|uniref:V/A-type H+-transporting ATPase subunit C n=1 Tax=Lactonifactor longoviformis DSM 17459 TaxID=1122155 RepID=A0A1M5CCU4_9CLOT|nr:V-type ATPase subunit [Lactonifactor longoviformis]POP32312.1 V-type ATP synthase subunit C [Lactonifactor longoviformis]SHF52584.1 V/A-type H+-transporting ATPase subunit C [Lactonifactor longoviformis DSM 17459]
MSDIDFTYAVARTRALEVHLFSASTIEQLLACTTYEECLDYLLEKGWGDDDTPRDAESILSREREKAWETVRELAPDMSMFDVLFYPNLFHNLKAAIKEVCTSETNAHIFYEDSPISGEQMMEIIREKDFGRLPQSMVRAAQDAYDTLLHTRDGQLCDVIVDKAALDAIYAAGKAAEDDIIRDYAESVVAVADIKIAVRAQKTAKTAEFMKRAMADCSTISVNDLIRAAGSSMEAIQEYLSGTVYAAGAKALEESTSAFERWCDNRIIETIKPQKYNSDSVGPIFAYAIARENEIKTVRIVLTGKQNDLPVDSIRERVREMYV